MICGSYWLQLGWQLACSGAAARSGLLDGAAGITIAGHAVEPTFL